LPEQLISIALPAGKEFNTFIFRALSIKMSSLNAQSVLDCPVNCIHAEGAIFYLSKPFKLTSRFHAQVPKINKYVMEVIEHLSPAEGGQR
jgi:hypothetical protein